MEVADVTVGDPDALKLVRIMVGSGVPVVMGDPNAVEAFYRRHEAKLLLHKALILVGEVFPNLLQIALEVAADPEEDVQWLVVRATADAQPAELRAAYREYVKRWVMQTAPDKRSLVRLSYKGS